MTVSASKLIGAVVQRTMDALNADPAFVEAAKAYELWPNCFQDGKLHLWHYPGTPNEIANVLVNVGKLLKGAALKFPAVLNFHPIRQSLDARGTGRPEHRITYNLAIIAPVRKDWLTQDREQFVFEPILRPIYAELIRQIKRFPAFAVGYELPYDYYEVFTTGGSAETVAQRYGDYIDAIEIHDLTLTLRPTLCDRDLAKLYAEADKVTENISNVLNKQNNV